MRHVSDPLLRHLALLQHRALRLGEPGHEVASTLLRAGIAGAGRLDEADLAALLRRVEATNLTSHAPGAERTPLGLYLPDRQSRLDAIALDQELISLGLTLHRPSSLFATALVFLAGLSDEAFRDAIRESSVPRGVSKRGGAPHPRDSDSAIPGTGDAKGAGAARGKATGRKTARETGRSTGKATGSAMGKATGKATGAAGRETKDGGATARLAKAQTHSTSGPGRPPQVRYLHREERALLDALKEAHGGRAGAFTEAFRALAALDERALVERALALPPLHRDSSVRLGGLRPDEQQHQLIEDVKRRLRTHLVVADESTPWRLAIRSAAAGRSLPDISN